MQRYEYNVDYINVGHASPEEFRKKMNEYGEKGWEVINVLFLGRQVSYPYQVIMKRPIETIDNLTPPPPVVH